MTEKAKEREQRDTRVSFIGYIKLKAMQDFFVQK